MGLSRIASLVAPVLAVFTTVSLGGCMQHHEAKVQSALLPPPGTTPVQHTGKLWVELGNATWENQCRSPQGQRLLCFDGVRRAAFGALERSLWTSFPEVALRDGKVLHEERLGSRSRAAFPYGSALGVGAGEVVAAFAVHVAEVLGAVAEDRPLPRAPLPAVVAEVLTPPANGAAPASAPTPQPALPPSEPSVPTAPSE